MEISCLLKNDPVFSFIIANHFVQVQPCHHQGHTFVEARASYAWEVTVVYPSEMEWPDER